MRHHYRSQRKSPMGNLEFLPLHRFPFLAKARGKGPHARSGARGQEAGMSCEMVLVRKWAHRHPVSFSKGKTHPRRSVRLDVQMKTLWLMSTREHSSVELDRLLFLIPGREEMQPAITLGTANMSMAVQNPACFPRRCGQQFRKSKQSQGGAHTAQWDGCSS